jgi:hypothetical protein
LHVTLGRDVRKPTPEPSDLADADDVRGVAFGAEQRAMLAAERTA